MSLQGPFDAAFFNSVFGNILDQREALLCTALLLKPGMFPSHDMNDTSGTHCLEGFPVLPWTGECQVNT